MYCNAFFHCLAVHMLSSETCMHASQESLSNKRVHQDNKGNNAFNDEIIDLNTQSNKRTAYMCDERINSTHKEPKLIQTMEQSITNPSDISMVLEDDDDGCINVFTDSDNEMEIIQSTLNQAQGTNWLSVTL